MDFNPAALGNWVPDFVRINNRLSGIHREPTVIEISAHRGLLARNELAIENLEIFVFHIANGAGWRDNNRAIQGDEAWSSDLRADVATIILAAKRQAASPERLHRIFRLLRPFTDGNARCARALYVWQALRLDAGEHEKSVIQAPIGDVRDDAVVVST